MAYSINKTALLVFSVLGLCLLSAGFIFVYFMDVWL